MLLPGFASFPFGVGFGVAAAQKGLSAFEVWLMSFTVFAGTSQMVALDLWAQPLPLVAIAISVFVANLRYFVMGAALQPYLPMLQSVVRFYRRYLPSSSNADQFAAFIEQLDGDGWDRLASRIPPEIADADPATFDEFDEVRVTDLVRAAAGQASQRPSHPMDDSADPGR